MTTTNIQDRHPAYLKGSSANLCRVLLALMDPPRPLSRQQRKLVDEFRAELRHRELHGNPSGGDSATPVVPVVAVRARDCWSLEFACPWCKPSRSGKRRTHYHGGGSLDGAPDGGDRASHCHAKGAPDSYYLVIVEIEPAEAQQ